MTSRQGGHAGRPQPPSTSLPSAAAKVQVQHPLSRDTIAIHFSALGKGEEEEEEELYGTAAPSSTPSVSLMGKEDDGTNFVEAQEASELLECGDGVNSVYFPKGVPMFSTSSTVTLPSTQNSQDSGPRQPHASGSSSTAAKGPASTSSATAPKSSSPSRSITLPSTDKPFLNLIKSLSSDLDPRDGTSLGSTVRHRQLMKNLVKSLSSDTSQDSSGSYRLPDSLQLFKQFTQSRGTTGASATGDSKTAPSSPLTSPDSRFSFRPLSEVEARIEDTKRRFSEAMYEPLQRLSKIIGDESTTAGAIYRPKGLSTSASELSNLGGLNGHLESNNNNYSIKEEEGDSDGEGTASVASPATESPLVFDKCSMSVLARQEDEEFCELYSEDFDFCTDIEADGERTDNSAAKSRAQHLLSTDTCSEDELEGEEPAPSIPTKTLFALTLLTYGYFVLPLPTYMSWIGFGMALGFMIAIGVVWLAGPKRSGWVSERRRNKKDMWSSAQLDIKEPGMFKVDILTHLLFPLQCHHSLYHYLLLPLL